ncbi:hypothetical protein [Saccharospirillum sp.]|uniref:hypothetical protein n=1 Tax=Saccharospirillum sp. TaxID=2033801 RepID=UPI0034A073C5
MCGDFEHDDPLDDQLFDQLLAAAKQLGIAPEHSLDKGNRQPMDPRARAAYMDTLFNAALSRSLTDAVHIPAGERMDGVFSQAIVFARLAGFLAGQIPADANPMKAMMEALLEGMNQAESLAGDIDHDHHHHHGHHHHG